MYIYKNGSKRRRDGWEVELAVPDVELEAALTTGGLIGTTGRKIRGVALARTQLQTLT